MSFHHAAPLDPVVSATIADAARSADARYADDKDHYRVLYVDNVRQRHTQRVVLDRPVLVMVLQGQKLLHLDGGTSLVEPGGTLVGAARDEVTLTHIPVDGVYACVVVLFPNRLLEQFSRGCDIPTLPFAGVSHPAVHDALAHLLVALSEPTWPRDVVDVRLQAVLQTLWTVSARVVSSDASARDWARHDVTTGIRSLVRARPGDRWTTAALSRALATSPATLKRKVQAADTTVDQVIWQERSIVAQALLDDVSMSIEQVAHAVGYASASKFSMRFRAEEGLTPSSWRARRPASPQPELS